MEDGIPLIVRERNDRAYSRLWVVEAEKGDFACECGTKGCDERVELLVIEYAARGDQPLLAPGHALARGEPPSSGDS
jgi:hypothetical protein